MSLSFQDAIDGLRHLTPTASFIVDGTDTEFTIIWQSEEEQPTIDAIEEASAAGRYNREYALISDERHDAYTAPNGPDAIYLRYQRGDASEQEWLDAVQAVKDAHPYPNPA